MIQKRSISPESFRIRLNVSSFLAREHAPAGGATPGWRATLPCGQRHPPRARNAVLPGKSHHGAQRRPMYPKLKQAAFRRFAAGILLIPGPMPARRIHASPGSFPAVFATSFWARAAAPGCFSKKARISARISPAASRVDWFFNISLAMRWPMMHPAWVSEG